MTQACRRPRRVALSLGITVAAMAAGVALAADPPGGFTVSDDEPVTKQTVTFSADVCTTDVTCEWAFGDGDTDSGASVEHSYLEPDVYVASLHVDPTAIDPPSPPLEHLITVVANTPPIGSASVSPTTGTTDMPVTFSASATDPEAKPLTYEWSVGSGNCDGALDRAMIVCTYSVPNTHTATVTITDSGGEEITRSTQVVLPNRAPTVVFSYSPNPFTKNTIVTFSAEASDPERRLKPLEWDLNGDGEFGDAIGNQASSTYTKPTTVRVRATDLDAGTATAALTVTPDNKAPKASFAPGAAILGVPTTFAASASDDDGAIAAYAWDFDGDGFDDGAAQSVFWTFTTSGSNGVWLRVTDDDGSTFVVYRDVDVTAASATQGGAPATQASPAAPPQTTPIPPGPVALRALAPAPVVRLAGALTDKGARLRILSIKAPKGTRVRVTCRGRGCPERITLRSAGQERRLRSFERAYRAGVRIEVRVTKAQRIGTYVRFTIRKGKAPRRDQRCLWPGDRAPRSCVA